MLAEMKEKPDPRIFQLWMLQGVLIGVLFALGPLVYLILSGIFGWPWAPGIMGLSLVVLLTPIFSYTVASMRLKKTGFTLDEHGIELQKGLISTKRIYLPRQKIVSAAIETTFLMELFNLSALIIRTQANLFKITGLNEAMVKKLSQELDLYPETEGGEPSGRTEATAPHYDFDDYE